MDDSATTDKTVGQNEHANIPEDAIAPESAMPIAPPTPVYTQSTTQNANPSMNLAPPSPNPTPQNTYPNANPTPPQQPIPPSQPADKLAIVSLVCGCLSLFGGWLFFSGLPLGIAAVITGSIALKKKLNGKGLSIGGIATGSIAIIYTAISLLVYIFALTLTGSILNLANKSASSNPKTTQERPIKTNNTNKKELYKDALKGETLTTFGGLEISVPSISRNYPPDNPEDVAGLGTEIVIVHATITNPTSKTIFISGTYFDLASSEGMNNITIVNSLSSTQLAWGNIGPGESTDYDLPFTILKDDTGLKLQYAEKDIYVDGELVNAYSKLEL